MNYAIKNAEGKELRRELRCSGAEYLPNLNLSPCAEKYIDDLISDYKNAVMGLESSSLAEEMAEELEPEITERNRQKNGFYYSMH